MNLHDYDLVIINSSAGKDSLCALFEICRMATEQAFPFSKIQVSHQDLGMAEWEGTKDLAELQATFFGLPIHYSKMRDKHLQQYVDEFVFRYNTRQYTESFRFDAMLNNINVHLTYKQLTNDTRNSRKMEAKQGRFSF